MHTAALRQQLHQTLATLCTALHHEHEPVRMRAGAHLITLAHRGARHAVLTAMVMMLKDEKARRAHPIVLEVMADLLHPLESIPEPPPGISGM